MKIEHLNEYITITIASLLGMGLALYLGGHAGSGDIKMPAIFIAGVGALLIALTMRERLWILIPLCWTLNGTVAGMPESMPVNGMVIVFVFMVFLFLKALKIVKNKVSLIWLDYILIANLLYLLTVYIRNPVGTFAMGFNLVGGRPYVEAVFAILAFWVIGHATISPRLARKMPWICAYAPIFVGGATVVAKYIPSTAPILNNLYSGTSTESVLPDNPATANPDAFTFDRPMFLGNFGTSLVKALYSVFPPFSTLNPLHIGRFLLSALALFAILKSGFRSMFFFAGLFFIVSAYFRSGMIAVIKFLLICVPLVAGLVLVQGNLVELPLSVQRSLSFLPGQWNPQIVSDAHGSTEWRLQIWERVMDPTNRYIVNWWFGDGFGMTRNEVIESMQSRSDIQESLTISGDYHSLPLSTIHIVGYCGGLLLVILMLGMAFYSWRLIRKSRDTPYFWIALFIGVPIVIDPLFGFFVFGAYSSQIVSCIYGVAMLRIISRSLEQYLAETQSDLSEKEFPAVGLSISQFSGFQLEK